MCEGEQSGPREDGRGAWMLLIMGWQPRRVHSATATSTPKASTGSHLLMIRREERAPKSSSDEAMTESALGWSFPGQVDHGQPRRVHSASATSTPKAW